MVSIVTIVVEAVPSVAFGAGVAEGVVVAPVVVAPMVVTDVVEAVVTVVVAAVTFGVAPADVPADVAAVVVAAAPPAVELAALAEVEEALAVDTVPFVSFAVAGKRLAVMASKRLEAFVPFVPLVLFVTMELVSFDSPRQL